jgi:D-alanyl-D-alanine carboxypeptidase/D-alanyl-D-alanine-endopeptidase (penicillin-binding protein 4)
VGLVVQLAETGEVLFQQAGEKRFTSASVTKLVTAAVALDRLGPGHRWTTRLASDGPVSDGRLRGDLWVVGAGDPTLGPGDLARWASRLRAAGVRRIEGDVVGDGRAFEPPRWGRGWMWDDLHLGWATGVTGLQLDDAAVGAFLLPGEEIGSPARVRVAEPDSALPVPVEARTGAPGSRLRLDYLPAGRPGDGDAPGGGVIRGWVPADADSVELSLASVHPTRHLLGRWRRVLADSGISVAGDLRLPRPGEAAPVDGGAGGDGETDGDGARSGAADRDSAGFRATLRSDSLGAVLADVLRPSDNQGAEALLRTLGREEGRKGSAEEGLGVVLGTLAGWGIDPGAVSLADGSGLSRYDQLAPRAVTRLLRAMWRSPHYGLFADALPAPGESGTLRARFLGTPAREAVRAKTGSLSSVRGLAGYVEDGDGETLVFALLVNGYAVPGDVAEGLRDLLVEQLSLFHRPVVPGWPGYRELPGGGPLE